MSSPRLPLVEPDQGECSPVAGEALDHWNDIHGYRFRMVRTQVFSDRSGAVRVDAIDHTGHWCPIWAFSYDGPCLGRPRMLSPDMHALESVEREAAPRWSDWWRGQ